MPRLRDMVDSDFDIHAGGPGSGCRGPSCGRKGGKGTEPGSSTAPARNTSSRHKTVPVAMKYGYDFKTSHGGADRYVRGGSALLLNENGKWLHMSDTKNTDAGSKSGLGATSLEKHLSKFHDELEAGGPGSGRRYQGGPAHRPTHDALVGLGGFNHTKSEEYGRQVTSYYKHPDTGVSVVARPDGSATVGNKDMSDVRHANDLQETVGHIKRMSR